MAPNRSKYQQFDRKYQIKDTLSGIFNQIALLIILISCLLTVTLCLYLIAKVEHWRPTEKISTTRSNRYSVMNDDFGDSTNNGTHIRKPEISHTPGFKAAAKWLTKHIDADVDPCENFYEYTCGDFKKNNLTNSFILVQGQDDDVLIEQIGRVSEEDMKAIKQTRYAYDACMKFNPADYTGSHVISVLQNFKQKTGIVFPLFDPGKEVPKLHPEKLAQTLALFSAYFGVNTLINEETETNWLDPAGRDPYLMYIDQGTLSYAKSFYEKGTFATIEEKLRKSMKSLLSKLASAAHTTLEAKSLDDDVNSMIMLEVEIARNLMASVEERRKVMPQWNPVTVRDAQLRWPFLDWEIYLVNLADGMAAIQRQVQDRDYTFIVKDPKYFDALNEALTNERFTQRTLQNYLMYRFISTRSAFINPPSLQMDSNQLWYRSAVEIPNGPWGQNYFDEVVSKSAVNAMTNRSCSTTIRFELIFAAGRLYTEAFPLATREKITEKMKEMIENVVLAFQTMVDGLPWMSEEVRMSAYDKIKNLQKNIIAPDWIFNDAEFERYHENLDIEEEDNYFDVKLKLAKFAHRINMEYLGKDERDRQDFATISPATVNAWYQPQVNSISFPMATLHLPFFDPEWPISMNYGALGSVMGHEFTHGFDDGGVQWDGIGKLNPWMKDNETIEGFNRLRRCVVDEYNKFCPLPKTYTPSDCINGFATQGENIADNGGLIAAYRAYKDLINLKGPEKQLPGPTMSQFSHDQLFFLGFANIWCRPELTDAQMHNQILIDPHSPDKFRVLGTIRNFPAFQDAFHCPTGMPMSPGEHCNVWVGDNKNG